MCAEGEVISNVPSSLGKGCNGSVEAALALSNCPPSYCSVPTPWISHSPCCLGDKAMGTPSGVPPPPFP